MKVCILGSGLTALTLAKALVNQNIYVDIISSKKDQELSKSRTLGISKDNIDFFNKNIINIDKLIWKLLKIEIFTDNLKNEIAFYCILFVRNLVLIDHKTFSVFH